MQNRVVLRRYPMPPLTKMLRRDRLAEGSSKRLRRRSEVGQQVGFTPPSAELADQDATSSRGMIALASARDIIGLNHQKRREGARIWITTQHMVVVDEARSLCGTRPSANWLTSGQIPRRQDRTGRSQRAETGEFVDLQPSVGCSRRSPI